MRHVKSQGNLNIAAYTITPDKKSHSPRRPGLGLASRSTTSSSTPLELTDPTGASVSTSHLKSGHTSSSTRSDVYHKKEKDKTTNHYCQYDSQTLTMFTSSMYFAAFISSIVAATVTRKFGQKLSMLFSVLLFCVGAIINGTAEVA
ncbi:hypothetical protein ACFX15_024504 [Malus domestica]